jgi:hypothetical protein
MDEIVTLITPTGGRPEAFALCQMWVLRQNIRRPIERWLRWIVVDDVDPPMEAVYADLVLRPEPRWQPGEVTLARNLLAALESPLASESDKFLIIEDDDWYAPTYVDTMADRLDKSHLVGEVPARYYNVETMCYRIAQQRELRHASLCATGFHRHMIDEVKDVLRRGGKFLDIELWRNTAATEKKLYYSDLVLGIKGMGGRPGIGAGHRGTCNKQDPEAIMLHHWIGDDAWVYFPQLRPPERRLT